MDRIPVGIMLFLAGYFWALGDVKYDCENYGKTKFITIWYQCTPPEKETK